MNNYESLTILFDNLSPVYIFTSIVTAITLICTIVCTKYLKACPEVKHIDPVENTSEEKESEKESSEMNANSGLLGQLRAAKLKKMEQMLTEEQLVEEKNIEAEQLAAIYKLLKEQESQYNTGELDESDLKRQLRLYR